MKQKPKISKNKETGLYEAYIIENGQEYKTSGKTIAEAISEFVSFYGKKFGMG
jgi:hypothetical protein